MLDISTIQHHYCPIAYSTTLVNFEIKILYTSFPHNYGHEKYVLKEFTVESRK